MMKAVVVVVVCLILQAARSVVIGAGFDGELEHTKLTRKPTPLRKGIGSVDFRITHKEPRTQEYFNQGIALLHGYDTRGADRSFYQASRIEPTCPMPWWGLAVANVENRPLATFYVRKASQLQETASDREKMWINAWLAYLDSESSEIERRTSLISSLDRILMRYPDDLEGCAFLVRQFLLNREAGMSIPLISATDLMIEQVLRKNPTHPVHHYKLLLWQELHPERARLSAEQVLREFPFASRIQTAAGQVFNRLERYHDALACFESSTASVCKQSESERIFPLEFDGFVENTGLQVDHLAIVGRVNEAVALSRHLIEMPAPETSASASKESSPPKHGHQMGGLRTRALPVMNPATIGQRRLLQILVDFHRWDELLKLESENYFTSTNRELQLQRIRAVGLAHFSRRDAVSIAAQIKALQQLRSTFDDSTIGANRSIQPTQIDDALRDLQWCDAVARNQPPSKTADQRLVELFPDKVDRRVAEKLAREPTTCVSNAAQHLNRIRILNISGQAEAATASFESMHRQFPGMDAELLKSVRVVAGVDNPTRSATAAARPSTPTWQPPPAPRFKLSDRHGNWMTLESFQGKPVVLVFYLGAGSPHSIEQFRSFVPLKEAYEQAGLTVIAVSTDSVAGLQDTFKVDGAKDAIPFQLVSDAKLSTFRDVGAFDSRDNEPLHGTFLIDSQGRIIWQYIGREQFKAARSLLSEARRVFSLGKVPP